MIAHAIVTRPPREILFAFVRLHVQAVRGGETLLEPDLMSLLIEQHWACMCEDKTVWSQDIMLVVCFLAHFWCPYTAQKSIVLAADTIQVRHGNIAISALVICSSFIVREGRQIGSSMSDEQGHSREEDTHPGGRHTARGPQFSFASYESPRNQREFCNKKEFYGRRRCGRDSQ